MSRTPLGGTALAAPSELAAAVLNELQARFPLEECPYEVVARRLETSAGIVRSVLVDAQASGLLRQLSAIFDTRALGYRSMLAAMRVAPGRLPRAIEVLNAHPGVSHNYERDHDFNLWFTIAVPPSEDLEDVLGVLAELTRAESIRALPAIRTYKIGVTLDAGGHAQHGRDGAGDDIDGLDSEALPGALSHEDVPFIVAAQRDWSMASDPFVAIAAELGCTAAEVVERVLRLRGSGHLRRFGGLLNHRRAGFAANGMAVWPVAADRADSLGAQMASFRAVTHCYQRPAYVDWPYSLFTMVHGANSGEVETVVAEIAAHTGIEGYRILYSTREFKKTRLQYFTPDHAQWRTLCARAAEA